MLNSTSNVFQTQGKPENTDSLPEDSSSGEKNQSVTYLSYNGSRRLTALVHQEGTNAY